MCEWRGTVKVGDYSDGPIPWPIKWGTRHSLILCGDLVEAVKRERKGVTGIVIFLHVVQRRPWLANQFDLGTNIPEPSTITFLSIGLVAFLLF